MTILDSNAIISATAISEDAYLLTNDARLKTVKNLKVKEFVVC